MKIIDNDEFLQNIATQGIGLDARYSEQRTLGYQNDLKIRVPIPDGALERAKAFSAAMSLCSDDAQILLWRRSGIWKFGTRHEKKGVRDDIHMAIRKVFSMAGVEQGCHGTLALDASEKDLLFALMFMNSLGAWCVLDDIFVVPDNQGFVLWFDHDGLIILQCRDQETHDKITKAFLAELERLGVPIEHSS